MTDLELTQMGQIQYLRERLESERQQRIEAEQRAARLQGDADMLGRLVQEMHDKLYKNAGGEVIVTTATAPSAPEANARLDRQEEA
jgi:hypothetical protein